MFSSKSTDPIESLEKFLYQGPLFYNFMPSFIKKRVTALKNLQIEQINLEAEFHKEVHELELKYAKKFEPLYQKRFEIISGKVEPTDKEATLPEGVVDYNEDENIENERTQEMLPEECKPPKLTEEEEAAAREKIKGVPGFWLGAMMGSENFADAIEDSDRDILKYLADIRVKYGATAAEGFTLEFHFEQNPYFTDTVLTKKYILKDEPDKADPFSYEGAYVVKSEGCKINWNEGKNPTKKTVTKRQRHKTNGTTRNVSKVIDQDSFFHFFEPPTLPENKDDLDEETSALASVDFELGELIRAHLIPNAVLYYTGYVDDDDDDEDDDDDDDDDDMDDEEDSLAEDSQ